MAKIAFFCIPAHGHTNPTLAVVKLLVEQGHEVRYYSYNVMKEKIERTGAAFVSCDGFDIQMKLKPEDAARIGKDMAFSAEVLVNTTLAMDELMIAEMEAWHPHCIVADSMALWGKLAALKLNIPFVSSTTTFAFNKESAKVMKKGLGELVTLLMSMGKANRQAARLREKGYPIKNFLSVIANDNDTHTIVYTSKEFQPYAETFSDKYVFVGPSIRPSEGSFQKTRKRLIYISMGTVNNQQLPFFKSCVEAMKDVDAQVVLSMGNLVSPEELGTLPPHMEALPYVPQLSVLEQADAFLTHCGMNSVSEALYYGVPLVLFPQTREQSAVANRAKELGAGIFLKDASSTTVKAALTTVLEQPSYKTCAEKIGKSFHRCAGAAAAAEKILQVTAGT